MSLSSFHCYSWSCKGRWKVQSSLLSLYCLPQSPSRRNVGTQKKSILTRVCCFVTFTEWCWLPLTFDLSYALSEWSQTPITVEFKFLRCCVCPCVRVLWSDRIMLECDNKAKWNFSESNPSQRDSTVRALQVTVTVFAVQFHSMALSLLIAFILHISKYEE